MIGKTVSLRLRVAGWACLGLTVVASAAHGGLYDTNLLGNPSFEDYYTVAGAEWSSGLTQQYGLQPSNTTDRGVQPWIDVGYDVCGIRTDGPGSGRQGDYYGMGGRFNSGIGESARMRQDIDLLAIGFTPAEIDGAELEMEAGAYLSSWNGDDDSVGFSIVLLDGDFSEIATPFATGPQIHDTWTLYQTDAIALPAGVRYIRFEVEFIKSAGDNNDGRIDDAWVKVYRPSVATPMVGRNLLANPGFEAATQGWRPLVGNARARLTGLSNVPARAGAWLLFGGQRPLGENQQRSAMVQDVYLADYGFTPAVLNDPAATWYLHMEAWLYSYGNVGQARCTVKVFDDQDGLLLEYDTGRVRSSSLPTPRHHQAVLPPDAVRLEFVYDAVDPGGTNLDGYLDEAVLRIDDVPHVPAFNGPQIVGHRGNSIVAPENTVAAMLAAKTGGAQLAEFDGRVCATGELVLMHDSTVDRTTDGSGAVSALSLTELKQYDAGSWFSTDFIGEPIPTLAETLAALLPDVTPLIEQKSGSAADYVAALVAADAAYDVVVQSFNWGFLSGVHQLDPDIRLAALGSGALTAASIQSAEDAGASTLAWAKGNVSAAEVAMVHDAGLGIFVWTVNDADEMAYFIGLGVDGIITDNPAGVAWLATPAAPPVGDLDADGDVDLTDYQSWWACLSGPGMPAAVGCEAADLDGDGDADLADGVLFQRQFGVVFTP